MFLTQKWCLNFEKELYLRYSFGGRLEIIWQASKSYERHSQDKIQTIEFLEITPIISISHYLLSRNHNNKRKLFQ